MFNDCLFVCKVYDNKLRKSMALSDFSVRAVLVRHNRGPNERRSREGKGQDTGNKHGTVIVKTVLSDINISQPPRVICPIFQKEIYTYGAVG